MTGLREGNEVVLGQSVKKRKCLRAVNRILLSFAGRISGKHTCMREVFGEVRAGACCVSSNTDMCWGGN